MGTNRDAMAAQKELLRALEASSLRLDALEARVDELERQNEELRALLPGSEPGADAGNELWVEELPEESGTAIVGDPEIDALNAALAEAPNDTSALARLAERAELLGDVATAVDMLERLAGELPMGRERRRALLHAARLARTGLDDAPRALALARAVLVDHPSDAEARKLVSLYAVG